VQQHLRIGGAEHVVEFLVDRGEIVGDLVHSRATEDSSEPGQSQIPRRQPLGGEEAFDGRRVPDDSQPIVVTDQLDLVVHRPLPKRGQDGSPVADASGRVRVVLSACSRPAVLRLRGLLA